MAPRRKYIDRRLLKALCHSQLTDEEIAVAMRVDRTTLWRRYATAIKAWKNEGVLSMRRRLYTTALQDRPIFDKLGNEIGTEPASGAVTSMIFFLKNFAGMSDNKNEKKDLELGNLPVSDFTKPDTRSPDKPN